MSFDYPQEPSPRKKGGCGGIGLLLLIGVGVFLFMNMRGAGTMNDGEPVEQTRRPVEGRSQGKLDPRFDRDLKEADEYRRQRDSVLGGPKPKSDRSSVDRKAMPSGQTTGDDGWTIEDVDGKKKTSPDAKKTKGKDGWSIEEVPTKKKSSTGFEAKRSGGSDVELTEKSGWSVEDVDPKTKKTKGEDGWSIEEVEGGGK